MDEKTLNILLRFTLDTQAQGRIRSGINTLETELDKVRAKSLAVQKSLIDMSESAQQAGRDYTKIFATGAGITGGIFAAAERYVRTAKVATSITEEWTSQTNKLQNSQSRIGATLAKEALPMLKQATELASRAATFVERNPEIVKAALNTGVAVATLGAVGMAVSKGVKLYADVKLIAVGAQQVLAGKLMSDAAKAQLAAAGVSKVGGLGLGAAATGTAAGTTATAASSVLLPIVTTVVALLAGSYLGTKLGNAGGKAIYGDQWKDQGFGEAMKGAWETTRKIALLASPLHLVAGEAQKLGIISGETRTKIFNLEKSILGLGESAAKKSVGVKGQLPAGFGGNVSDDQRSIVDAYTDMLKEEKEATKQYASDRLSIITGANSNELQIIRNGARARSSIMQNYEKTILKITEDFQKSNAAAEQAYQQQRAQAIQAANIDIQRMEQDHKENMRKLLVEHNDRVNDLVGQRDALGLALENRSYNRKRKEEEDANAKAIARRRQDLAILLRDMAQNAAAERAARLAEYKQQMADAEEQKKEELKRLAEATRLESEANRKAKEQALRELDIQHKTEQTRRREAFVAYVRDLDAAMLGEQRRRQSYYKAMLADVEAFLAQYRKSLPGGSSGSGSLPIRDSGGYASKGIYGLAQNGKTEYVLSGDTTRAAEKLIGGRLTQDGLLSALRSGARSVITWNDQRRFDSRLSGADRRVIQRDTLDTLAGVLS